MEYPPPPMLTWMAYCYGSITRGEMLELIELWNKKHKEEER